MTIARSKKEKKTQDAIHGVPNIIPMAYFAKFANFREDPANSIIANFQALALNQKWNRKKKNKEYSVLCHDEFNRHLGHIGRAGDVGPWRALLCELGVHEENIPESIKKCRMVLIPKY